MKPTADELLDARSELRGTLRAFFARRVPAADVDDLVQECHLRVSQGLAGLRSRERLDAWIFRIAHNLVADHRRRRQRHPEAPLESEPVAGDGPDAAGAGLERRIAGWLASMVDRLPPRYASAVRESELEGRPHREIAARLGLSVSAVKSRVQRGRALLRGLLAACCTIEFDARGGIRDYERNDPGACGC